MLRSDSALNFIVAHTSVSTEVLGDIVPSSLEV